MDKLTEIFTHKQFNDEVIEKRSLGDISQQNGLKTTHSLIC